MTVEFSGPLFDGTADKLLQQGADAAELAVAERVQDTVRSILRGQARHRTGVYEQHVVVDRSQADLSVVDRGVRYGGWLEGDWPRNKSTGFPGYHPWQKAYQQVEPKAAEIAEPVLGKYIERMG